MKVQEQALLSGLVFADRKDEIKPQWRPSSKNWTPLMGRHVWGHASVLVHHPAMNRDKLLVLSGGWPGPISDGATNLVSLMNVGDSRWQTGPPLQEKRRNLASVVCNGAVYVIGGFNGHTTLDTIERIPVGDLLHSSSSSSSSSNSSNGWKMMNCRLTSKRHGCAAVAVCDRFIVVAGGQISTNDSPLSSVDILDTASGNPYSVLSGPSLKEGRSFFAMAVVGSRIFAIGGRGRSIFPLVSRQSVEYLEFDDWLDAPTATSSVTLSTKSWTVHKELILNKSQAGFTAVQVGSCLVVAGGYDDSYKSVYAVEVLDTVRNMVWELPDLTKRRDVCDLVSLSNTLSVITQSSGKRFSCETLSLMDMKSWLFARLLEIGKVPT